MALKCSYSLCRVAVLLFLCMNAVCGTYTNRWAVRVPAGERVARSVAAEHGFHFVSHIFGEYYELEHPRVMKRSAEWAADHHSLLESHPHVHWTQQQVAKSRSKRDLRTDVKRDVSLNDPQWPRMWYLNRRGHDMNVQAAWQQGYTGKGTVVTILDDGIEKNHPDLMKNYDPEASYDINSHDPDPQPRYDFTNFNRHGTRCAGEVAAEANNNICSVGVAYNAGIGGVRMLDGDVTDSVEAQSLSLNIQHIDIYSASWGPDDDGKTVDGPGPLAKQAFQEGINNGRGGRGSIFVWASGNGGRDHDACSCDGYTNSIETLSVSSASQNGQIPWYLEPCASTLATTYSSGGAREKQVLTTDLRKGCTETHTGTSASAPMAAGIVALTLEANPDLTWRDLQYIVLMAAKPTDLHANDWVTNAVGRRVSHAFGYGLMDAGAMTELASRWKSLPPQHQCVIDGPMYPTNRAGQKSQLTFTLNSEGCKDSTDKVVYLEHVQVILDMDVSRRGDIELFLTSPQGTRSVLLQKRPRDTANAGFSHWPFLTVHSWGEIATGHWTLEVKTTYSSAVVNYWKLVLYGTEVNPQDPSADEPQPAKHAPTPNPTATNSTTKPIAAPATYRCKENEYFLHNFCYQECPTHFFPKNETIPKSSPSNATKTNPVCQQCHLLCLACSGPQQNQCLSCAGGYKLMSNKTCVHVFSKTSHHQRFHGSITLTVILVCAAAAVFFFVIFLCLQARDRGYFSYYSLNINNMDMENGKKFGLLINHDSESEEEYSKDPVEYSD